MRVKRHRDTVTLEITGTECAEWLGQQFEDAIEEQLDATERLIGVKYRQMCRISLVVDLGIEDPYRLSDAILDFPTMIEIKGRPPSRKAQFCTEKLKLIPQRRWIRQQFGPGGPFEGWDFIRYTGVRRDESNARAGQQIEQWDTWYDCPLVAPIADWTKQMCFDYVKAHGEQINPLYTLGFNRVGCAPCINSGKEDIRNWNDRFPEMIDKIRSWEKRTGRTFFAPCIPGKATNFIDEVVEWAQTSRGGTQFQMFPERPACESKYGLCE